MINVLDDFQEFQGCSQELNQASFPYNNRHGVLEGLCEHAPGADSVRWEGLCLQQSPEAVSPRGALGPGGLWFLVMCTLDGPSLA